MEPRGESNPQLMITNQRLYHLTIGATNIDSVHDNKTYDVAILMDFTAT